MLGRERTDPLPAGRLFRSDLNPTPTHGSRQHPRRPACLAAHPRADRHATGSSSSCSPCRCTSRSRTSSDEGNLSRLGENLVAGLSNGAIWALVAIGYTLVYGIVELINFAHGEVFMIGSFISASFIATLGLHGRLEPRCPCSSGCSLDARRGDGRLRHAQRADRAGRLQTVAQRAQAGAADHRGRHVLHPAERRPAVEGRLQQGIAGPHQRAAHAVHDLRRHDRERRRARRSGSRSRCCCS